MYQQGDGLFKQAAKPETTLGDFAWEVIALDLHFFIPEGFLTLVFWGFTTLPETYYLRTTEYSPVSQLVDSMHFHADI